MAAEGRIGSGWLL